VTVSGSGFGAVDCNISFTAPSSQEICYVSVIASDETGGTVLRNTTIKVGNPSQIALAISAGNSHTCALTSGGGAKCWGYNYFGQIGDNSTTARRTPVDVCADDTCSSSLNNVVAISAGGSHTCALISGGRGKCWGNNIYGQLGDGFIRVEGDVFTTNRLTPVDVYGLSSGASTIIAGYYSSIAVVSGGAKSWGTNSSGAVGMGYYNRLTPVDVLW